MIAALIGLVPVLVNVAEKIFPGAKEGADKKSFVMAILKRNLDTLQEFKKVPELPEEVENVLLGILSEAIEVHVLRLKNAG